MASHSPLLGLAVTALPNAPRTLCDLAEGKATVRNLLTRQTPAGETLVFECQAFVPTDDGPHPFFSVVALRAGGLPRFALMPRPRFSFGLKPIEFEARPAFAKRFLLRIDADPGARSFFTPSRLDALLALPKKPSTQVEAGGGWLILCSELLEGEELTSLVDECARLSVGLSAPPPADA